MLHKFFEEGDWFEAKEAGYGAGLPTAWQGWVLLLAYLAVVLGIGLLFTGGDVIDIVIGVGAIILATLPFTVIVKRRTKGGWKWRP